MGKVYSPEEVSQRQIPEISAHAEAARHLLEELFARFTSQQEEAEPFNEAFYVFDGAMIYGSVATGNFNRRSDIDILITYERSWPGAVASGYREVFKQTEKEWKVPIESNVWDKSMLSRGIHTIDAAFLAHLRTIPSTWVVGNDPLEGITLKEENSYTLFHRYVSHKIRSFTIALSDTSEQVDTHRLQRALELPVAIGRKALSVLSPVIISSTPLAIPSDTVPAKLIEALDLDPEAKTVEEILRLQTTDEYYSNLLEAVINGDISLEEYCKTLKDIYKPSIANALDIATQIGVKVLATLEQ